jgi:hypothetical protein
MIYLATPYTHPEPEVRAARFLAVTLYCAERMAAGELIFSPITYGHAFGELGLAATDHVSWIQFNETMLGISTGVRVLCLRGWELSAGIQHEVEFADKHGIPVEYVSS